jgi:hypothetical protein
MPAGGLNNLALSGYHLPLPSRQYYYNINLDKLKNGLGNAIGSAPLGINQNPSQPA